MAGVAGLEPVTSAVTGQRSNQLSYTPRKERVNLKELSLQVNGESKENRTPKDSKKDSGSRRQGGGGGEPR